MSRPVRRTERAAWLAIPLVLVGVLVLFLGVGSLGPPRPELERIDVADVLAATDPIATYGTGDIRVVGWYANLDADCAPSADEPADPTWLERSCPRAPARSPSSRPAEPRRRRSRTSVCAWRLRRESRFRRGPDPEVGS